MKKRDRMAALQLFGEEGEAAPVELSRAELRQAKAAGTYHPAAQKQAEAAPEEPPCKPEEREDPMPPAGRARVNAIKSAWAQQEAEMRREYPEFALAKERSNPEFARLVMRGMPLRQAYESAHFEELMNRRAEQVARMVEQGVTARIESRGLRPAENGLRPGGALSAHTDVNSLSRAEREEIERQVLHGAKIRL